MENLRRSVLRRSFVLKVFCLSLFFTFANVAVAKPADHYSHTNSKGRTYFLFKKEVHFKNSDKVTTLYYFAKDPKNKKGTPLAAVPEDRFVHETKRGMLVLKNKESTKKKSK